MRRKCLPANAGIKEPVFVAFRYRTCLALETKLHLAAVGLKKDLQSGAHSLS